MRIRLVVEPAVPADVRPEVEAAVTAVWRAEGLTLTWLPEAAAGQADPTTNVWLRVVARPLDDVRARTAHPLGVVRVVGDIPGQGHVFGTTRYFRGWQDRALWEDEMMVVLGETEAATWHARFQDSIVSTETFVLRHRADLSRQPVGNTSEQQ